MFFIVISIAFYRNYKAVVLPTPKQYYRSEEIKSETQTRIDFPYENYSNTVAVV